MSEKLTVHECYPGVFRAYYDPEGHTGEGKNREEAIINLMEQEIDSYETRLATVAGQRDYLMKDQKVKDDMLKQLKIPSELLLLLSDPLMGPAITRFVQDVQKVYKNCPVKFKTGL